MRQNPYDYIIAGGGMAGLSLAFYLNQSPLRNKKILIIDCNAKDKNDHTWCFWQKEKSAFEKIVFHRWKTFWFHGTNNFSELLDLGDYEYKMIRAADFYKFVKNKINRNPNFTFLQSKIETISSVNNETIVKTSDNEFCAKEFVFDSVTRKNYDNPKYQNLWQHFVGWKIKTNENVFNPSEPTLFDFRVEQKNECRFIYILPFSVSEALIEFTVFSDDILERNEYETYLSKYIEKVLKTDNYEITEIENGVIPMSNEPHIQFPSPKIIRIGTAGGYIKPSTGYSFARTQKKLQRIVANLESDELISGDQQSSWKSYLDSVLLNVLAKKKHPAADVFTRLFQRNEPFQVLKFLDEDTSFREDLKIMKSVPLAPFSKAAIESARKIVLDRN